MPGRSRILNANIIQRLAPVPFYPTIIIGLGGTGKEVLLRLRRKFFEKYGQPGLPIIAYLWIDTDLRDISLDGKAIDYISDEIRFKPTELIDAQVSREDFETIFRNKNAYPNIFRWMDPAMEAHGSVVEGAGAFRPLGRLGFFHAFDNIDQKLTNHVTDIQAQATANAMKNLGNVDPNMINVYIVTSLAGGTGSGMFLDMAFFAKRKMNNANVIGFLGLPSLFTNDFNDRRYANGYAALKELEFYSLRKDVLERPMPSTSNTQDESEALRTGSWHDFDVEWKLGDRNSIWGPPFNTCYQIDNSTDRGGLIKSDQIIELCDMIAEAIFMDFSPSTDVFASQKRAIRKNLAASLLNDLEYEYLDNQGAVVHTDIFSYRFSTFGWSKIYVPMDRIVSACTYRLAEYMVDFWLKEISPPGDIKDTIRREIAPSLGIGMKADVSGSDIFRNLSVINDIGSKVDQIIGKWVTDHQNPQTERAKRKTNNLSKLISDDYEKFLRDNFTAGGLGTPGGEFLKRICIVNKNNVINQAKKKILDEMSKMLDNPRIRLDLAIKCLIGICELLDEQSKKFDDDYKMAEMQTNRWHQEIDRCLHIITEYENTKIYRRITLQAYIKHTFSAIKAYFNMRARMLIDQAAAEVCAELKKYIGYESEVTASDGKIKIERGGMILEMRQFADALKMLKSRLHDRFESFDKTEQPIIHVNLYKKGDFGNFYLVDGQPLNDDILSRLDGEFFTTAEGESSEVSTTTGGLLGLRDLLQSPGEQYVEDEMVRFCSAKFTGIKDKLKADAVKSFMNQYKNGERNQMIESFVSMGSGWLKKGSHFMGDTGVLTNIQHLALLGIADKRDSNYDEFKRLFNSSITAQVLNVNSDMACYYSEHAGIPLMYINNLDKYRQRFINLAGNPGAGLHVDRYDEKFNDILLKTDDEIRILREAIRILLTGSILRVINMFIDEGNILQYDYLRRNENEFPLGSEYMAIERIRTDENFRNELRVNIASKVGNFDAEKRIKYYSILDYYTNELFKPRFYRVNIVIERRSHEYMALSVVKEDIKKSILATLPEDQFEKDIADTKSKLDEFSELVDKRRRFIP